MGVLGQAISVMFKFVFLFVIFGAFLEMSGATNFIINFSQRLLRRSAGGPAKISVISSGLMGSLSGRRCGSRCRNGWCDGSSRNGSSRLYDVGTG
jgi:TRAP-type uncharacterized transport system fused permease subunit